MSAPKWMIAERDKLQKRLENFEADRQRLEKLNNAIRVSDELDALKPVRKARDPNAAKPGRKPKTSTAPSKGSALPRSASGKTHAA